MDAVAHRSATLCQSQPRSSDVESSWTIGWFERTRRSSPRFWTLAIVEPFVRSFSCFRMGHHTCRRHARLGSYRHHGSHSCLSWNLGCTRATSWPAKNNVGRMEHLCPPLWMEVRPYVDVCCNDGRWMFLDVGSYRSLPERQRQRQTKPNQQHHHLPVACHERPPGYSSIEERCFT